MLINHMCTCFLLLFQLNIPLEWTR
uniref:Uncharacterized protein n=1 Tax=Anguilla anguilla TaxID=7936 RepID=A0A0E9QLN4_ANGAN